MVYEKLGVIIFEEEIHISDISNALKEAALKTEICIPVGEGETCSRYCVKILDELSNVFDIMYVSSPSSPFARVCLNIQKYSDDTLKVSIGPRNHLSSFCSEITNIIDD